MLSSVTVLDASEVVLRSECTFQVDTSSLQAEEVWTGVTYAVAATMIQEVC